MKLTERNLQLTLTISLVALVGAALLLNKLVAGPAIQIAISLAVIGISLLSVMASGKAAKQAEREVTLGLEVAAEEVVRADAGAEKPLETKAARVVHGANIVGALYEQPFSIVPVYRDGNHFICDAEVDDNYSFSIGNVRIEVCEGEAKVTIKPAPAERVRPYLAEEQVPIRMI